MQDISGIYQLSGRTSLIWYISAVWQNKLDLVYISCLAEQVRSGIYQLSGRTSWTRHVSAVQLAQGRSGVYQTRVVEGTKGTIGNAEYFCTAAVSY